MAKILFCILFLFHIQAFSQMNRSLWMEYEFKSKEKISNVAKQSRTAFDKTATIEQLIQKIVSKNPELQGKTHIKAGQNILLPFSALPHFNHRAQDVDLPKPNGAQTVHYHVYYNPIIYNGSGPPPPMQQVATQPAPEKERTPAFSNPVKIKKAISDVTPGSYNLEVSAGSYYRLISVNQNAGGATTQASNLNYLVDASLTHDAWGDFNFHHQVSYLNESYEVGSTNLFSLRSNLEWELTHNFSVSGGISYLQTPVIGLNGTTVIIEPIATPQVGLGAAYLLPKLWNVHPVVGTQFDYMLGGSQNTITLNSGITYSIYAGLEQQLFNQKWTAKTWWSASRLELNTNKQELTGLGFSLAWNTDF